ncbi:sensor histidine kinase [Nonomuraea sp. NPDC050310]|uniref:sensor histidine kinase n=1 Tax=unclassified Nonomuraea TaxID=2593643 RepID=UPI0033DAA1DC
MAVGLGVVGSQVGVRDAVPIAAMMAAASIPLLVRRSHPLVVLALSVALDLAAQVWLGTGATSIQLLIALYSVGRYTSGRTTLIATVLTAVVQFIVILRVEDLLSVIVLFALTGLGQLVRVRAELTARRKRELLDNAVRTERRRIARELHDVVAHHISVINALVGGARAVLPPDPGEAREALLAAEQTSRQALAEMRKLLHVLRADGQTESDLSGIGAGDLPALVAQSGNASLEQHGEPVPLPAEVDHAVYRIVQEALTNTRKHAPGARVSVRLEYRAGEVEVEVLDDGPGSSPGAEGYGLDGMAERVSLCGGRLEAGPRASKGGFRVHALLPLE